ncbi:MAG: rhodanese-like domain-containing protein [Bacteroidetes bacterium]|nr:rhodanese-like domain-containing protein [Bacteroidota bacterium]
MKELTKTRRLTIASVIFVFILVIGFVTFRSPDFVYKLSTKATLEELTNPANIVSPVEAREMINGTKSGAVMIDLRNTYDYNKGTLFGAINIPVSDIMEKEVIEMFDDWQMQSKTVILFAEDQQAANAPWMILRQLGYSNMKVLSGGYAIAMDQYTNGIIDSTDYQYNGERPVMDFAGFIQKMSGGEVVKPNPGPAQIEPIKRKKKSVTAGGC